MHEHIDSWKNSQEAFGQQLDVNIRELNLGFPPHWQHFVSYMDGLEIDRVIDVGCGAGVYGFISKDKCQIVTTLWISIVRTIKS